MFCLSTIRCLLSDTVSADCLTVDAKPAYTAAMKTKIVLAFLNGAAAATALFLLNIHAIYAWWWHAFVYTGR